MEKRRNTERQPPVRIPLSFDQAIDGLLAVKPKPKKKPASSKKKPGRK